MQITKKDLLIETGISYGQLYRWKREKLIPEEWFMKQSSSTGQETYFPKEAILKRIERILELKDVYSLEDIARMLSPEVIERVFLEDDLDQFEEVDVSMIASFMDILKKDEFTYKEIIVLMAMSKVKKQLGLHEEIMNNLLEHCVPNIADMENISYNLDLYQGAEQLYVIFLSQQAKCIFDKQLKLKMRISLSDLSNEMKLKYKDTFQFKL